MKKITSVLAIAIGLPIYKEIIKRIARGINEHRLAIELLSQDENLKGLTNLILKKRNIIFKLVPVENKEIIWETRKIFYCYKIFMAFDPTRCSIIPCDKNEQLIWLTHEFLHIVLKHYSGRERNCSLCLRDCLKEELEAHIAINGVLKLTGVKVILDKVYWKNRIINVMKQCQEEGRNPKCLSVILNGKCPEVESIKLYLKMIALDAKEGFLSK